MDSFFESTTNVSTCLVWGNIYPLASKKMYVRLSPTANSYTSPRLLSLYHTTYKKEKCLYARAKHGKRTFSFLRLAHKAHQRFHVFGLGEHIVRLNFFNLVEPLKPLLRIGRIFYKLTLFVFH